MKYILLLGGYGFIGTNIIKYVDENYISDYHFIVFDRFPKHMGDLSFKSIEKVYCGDFGNISDLEKVFCENRIDIIIHSLSSTVPSTSLDPKFDIESNLVSTIQLLELQTKYHVPKIVYLSSGGAIYGHEETCTFSETHFSNPISSYGITKLAIEKYLHLYHIQHSINYLILRLSNPYGPYHYSRKQGAINIALRNAMNHDGFMVWGSGNGAKDYFYIEDFCSILFQLIKKDISNEVFNIGSGSTFSLNSILSEIKTYFPEFSWSYSSAHSNDVANFSLNMDKLLSVLPSCKFTSLHEGIGKTVKWLQNE